MKAALFGSLIFLTLILSAVIFFPVVQQVIFVSALSMSPSPPGKPLDARWDLSANLTPRAIGWPASNTSSVWKTKFKRFQIILPFGGDGGIFSNISASAWRTENQINEIALQFPPESQKDAETRVTKLKHDWNLDRNPPEKNYLEAWADRAAHEYFHYDPILNRSETIPPNPDWPPVGISMKPTGYKNLWCVMAGVRIPRD